MKKARSATEEITAYLGSYPTGKTTVSGTRIHAEFPKRGPLDKSNLRNRVEAWAAHFKLKVTAVGGTVDVPEKYQFEKQPSAPTGANG